MTKRRKKRKAAAAKPARRRSRRMSRPSLGAAMSFDSTHIMATAGGAAAATFVNKFTGSIDSKMSALIKIGGGIALPMLAKNAKTKQMLQSLGGGMIAVGTVELLGAFGVNGFGAPESNAELFVAIEGLDDLDVLNADVLAGDDIDVLNADVLAGEYDDYEEIDDEDLDY